MSDIFELADELAVDDAPSEGESKRLLSEAQKFLDKDREVAGLEERLKAVKAERKELAEKTLPAIMDEIGQDRIGLPGSEVDICLLYTSPSPRD